jgi:predicted dienelactone hydrolase
MRFGSVLIAFAMALLLVRGSQLQQPSSTYFSVPPADAPELAHRGTYSVGVRTIEITHPNQVDILRFDTQTGKAPLYDRVLKVEIWYPATISPGQEESTTYISAMPGRPDAGTAGPAGTFEIKGKALRDAPPLRGSRFPLVVVSHGYPGSRTFLTYLTENLASKGYVVAAIDHTDSVFGEVKGFPSTLLNRSSDQLFTIQALEKLSADSAQFLYGLVDAANAAIVGYSMGGYGALTSAGAGYSKTSPLMKFVPGNYLSDWATDSPKFQSLDRKMIKAIVAIAPWGAQPPYLAWDAEGLAALRVPSLFIAGDHDDVAEYAGGIKRIFEGAVNSQRYLLVYENARHNTGGNPPPSGVALDYRMIQSFDEPVWRKDRITAINQHFVTAFLDLYLKGDQSRQKYLQVPVPKSNDGQWKVPNGGRDDGAFSTGRDADGSPFWPGFQRRWALGLELYQKPAGQKAN